MKGVYVALIAAAVPPRVDGIGDYTGKLATELIAAAHASRVTVLTSNDAAGESDSMSTGVAVQGSFDADDPSTAWRLLDSIDAIRPDWVVLQYNPFGYGRRGLNLQLPKVMIALRRRCPGTRLAIMFHETYVPIVNWKFAIMTTWQRLQFQQLAGAADVLFFSTGKWADRHRRRYPFRSICHLPVGSNVPHVAISAEEARGRLGIEADEIVLGVFGTAHASRLFEPVVAAAKAIHESGRRARVLYIGGGGDLVRKVLGDRVNSIVDGPLPADEVSRRLSAVDLSLSTYVDGISTRRGAMMAALQHELAVVGTHGVNTDRELLEANGSAFVLTRADDHAAFAAAVLELANDVERRRKIASGGRKLFDQNYSWSAIAEKMMNKLHEFDSARTTTAGD